MPFRWEATGPAGGLFPGLDADLTLLPAGEQTKLVLAGSYRVPLDGFGAALDKMARTGGRQNLVKALARQVTEA